MTIDLSYGGGESNFHSWQIARHWANWHVASQYGEGSYTYYGDFPLTQNTWYYLLFRVGEDGQFYTQLWSRDDPSTYILNISISPAGSGWDDQTWSFSVRACSGTIRLDSYEELRFPANYEMPATPSAF